MAGVVGTVVSRAPGAVVSRTSGIMGRLEDIGLVMESERKEEATLGLRKVVPKRKARLRKVVPKVRSPAKPRPQPMSYERIDIFFEGMLFAVLTYIARRVDNLRKEIVLEKIDGEITVSELGKRLQKWRDRLCGVEVYYDGDRKCIVAKR